ncbi:MAG: ADOP family duplicated permease [Blastocatellia bacterium]
MREWKQHIRGRLARLKLEPSREAEIVEELAQHLEDRYEEARLAGASEEEARRVALSELSDNSLLVRGLKRTERAAGPEIVALGAGRGNMFADLWQDLRFGVRMMRKHRGFTFIAVLTLALGIGANTAIFSLVNAVLLRPLPYSDPDRLVTLVKSYPQKGLDSWGLSQADFAMYRDQNHVFEKMAGFTSTGFNLTGAGEPERLRGVSVTADFFSVLGVEPVVGRVFRPEEDVPGKNLVCVLSYGFWQRRFGGDPQIIGTSLNLNGTPTEVVGVMRQGFGFPDPIADVWVPLGLNPQKRNPYNLTAIARLKPGTSPSEARVETTTIMWNEARQGDAPPPEGADLKTIVTPLKKLITGETQKPLVVLLGAVGFVLLIACANVANLLLARATSRAREMAVRLALGASPRRVVRQLITESLLLALAGAAAGTALAWWGVRMIGRLPVEGIPRIDEVTVNGPVLMFTAGVAVLTGLLFGLAPALRAYKLGFSAGMREGLRGSASASSRRMNNALVAAQFALSVVLLVGAGLLLKSFQRLMSVDPGFQPDRVLSLRLSLPARKYSSPEQTSQFYRSLLEQVRGLPGVRDAGAISNLPFGSGRTSDGYVVEGHEPPLSSVYPNAQIRIVSQGYFQSLGIALLRGRDFSEADLGSSPPVAVVDETLALQYWPDGNAVGKRIRYGWATGPDAWMTIVGVVGGVKHRSLTETIEPHLYIPYTQDPQPSMYLVVRTAGDPAAVTSLVGGKIQGLDPDLPIYSVRTMTELVGRTLNSQRLTNLLLTAFSLLAVVLAAVGIYGVMSVYVSSRTTEFGIRLALGAEPRDLMRSILRQGMRLTAVGVLAGAAGAAALTRAIAGLLFEVSATDPVVYSGAALLLAAVAFAACYIPARRGSRVDPLVALRYE